MSDNIIAKLVPSNASIVVKSTTDGGFLPTNAAVTLKNTGLSAINVATLTANNTNYVGDVSAANVVSNTQLQSNLANYTTTISLAANLANYTTTTALTANLVNYAALSGATFTGNVSISNTFSVTANSYLGGAAGSESLRVIPVDSSVNYVQVTGGATGIAPIISAQGSDNFVNLGLQAKSAQILFYTRSGNTSFRIADLGQSPANYLQVIGSVAGASPSLSSQGTDTNIDLTFTPKGTGKALVAFNSGLGFANATGNSVAYTYYNAGSNSIDTVFA